MEALEQADLADFERTHKLIFELLCITRLNISNDIYHRYSCNNGWKATQKPKICVQCTKLTR